MSSIRPVSCSQQLHQIDLDFPDPKRTHLMEDSPTTQQEPICPTKESREVAELMLSLTPNILVKLEYQACKHYKQGLYREALNVVEEMLRIDPNCPWATENQKIFRSWLINEIFDKVKVQLSTKQYNAGLVSTQEALELSPKSCFALKSRVECFYQLEQYDNALKLINEIITQDLSDAKWVTNYQTLCSKRVNLQ